MKIFIRFGHDTLINGSFTGAVGCLTEKEVIESYASSLSYSLFRNGHEIKMFGHTYKEHATSKIALMAGIDQANEWGADLFISCHANAGSSSATGCEVLYKKDSSKKYATKVSEYISDLLNVTNRGAKYADDKGEVNYTNMPAIIIEPIFVTNQSDCNKFKDVGGYKLGQTIASAIYAANN